MGNELPKADLSEEIAYQHGLREVFLIEGDSMLPTLKSGEVILINPRADLCVGDIVLARHPYKKSVKMVKRIEQILPDERYFLIGDNPAASTDSRTFGAVSLKYILGKAVARIEDD
jgi:nickel-type superoxide dismutase maturation protease